MRRMMFLGVAAIAACAAAIAVASPARSGVVPGPFVDDWFSSSASAWTQNGLTYRQVVLVNADAKHMLTHTSTVQIYLLAPNVTGPVVTKTVTQAWKGTFTYKVATPTILQPVGIKIVATHIKQFNDPMGGVQPTRSSTAWYPHAP